MHSGSRCSSLPGSSFASTNSCSVVKAGVFFFVAFLICLPALIGKCGHGGRERLGLRRRLLHLLRLRLRLRRLLLLLLRGEGGCAALGSLIRDAAQGGRLASGGAQLGAFREARRGARHQRGRVRALRHLEASTGAARRSQQQREEGQDRTARITARASASARCSIREVLSFFYFHTHAVLPPWPWLWRRASPCGPRVRPSRRAAAETWHPGKPRQPQPTGQGEETRNGNENKPNRSEAIGVQRTHRLKRKRRDRKIKRNVRARPPAHRGTMSATRSL